MLLSLFLRTRPCLHSASNPASVRRSIPVAAWGLLRPLWPCPLHNHVWQPCWTGAAAWSYSSIQYLRSASRCPAGGAAVTGMQQSAIARHWSSSRVCETTFRDCLWREMHCFLSMRSRSQCDEPSTRDIVGERYQHSALKCALRPGTRLFSARKSNSAGGLSLC